tara:strand:- start:8455 stop:8580 length:126 start_codon:yes stop_codon:yes gene_type:complete
MADILWLVLLFIAWWFGVRLFLAGLNNRPKWLNILFYIIED